MTNLEYKSMTKSEFAAMVGVTVRTLNRWMIKIDSELSAIGYEKNCHVLTPKVVKFLFDRFVI